MANHTAQLKLVINGGQGADAEETARLGQQLRQDILKLDVDSVDFVRSGAAPAGAKGDPITLGALAITLAPGLITSLFNLLQSWLTRHEKSSVTIQLGKDKIVVTGNPSKEERQLIETVLARHQAA